ncbi:MAG: adenylate/guanylate cyclase domain-containing protein [Bacteroidia bacterium]
MFHISYKTRRQLTDIFWAAVFFLIGVNVYSMIRFWERFDYPVSELLGDAATATIGGIIGGILLGLFHQFVIGNRFRRKPFGVVILSETFIDLFVIIAVFIPVTTASGVWFSGRTWPESFAYNLDYMSTLTFMGLVIYLLVLSVLYNFMRQVSKKFGRGVMLGMLLGRYHQPREDNRIVMFLDLKSSTTHAERLGHIRYSRLLQDCFFDLNRVLISYEAHIYKYVGDEAIISWSVEAGIRDNICLQIFFGFHRRLEERRDWYESQYGILPEFKAGMNAGRITVAEVGEDRREIEYHGDVLNTAARIQGQCNIYGKKMLISQDLADTLSDLGGYVFEEIGELELKGKNQKVRILSVEER